MIQTTDNINYNISSYTYFNFLITQSIYLNGADLIKGFYPNPTTYDWTLFFTEGCLTPRKNINQGH